MIGCGYCFRLLAALECPAVAPTANCKNVAVGEICEADGECNTDKGATNCGSDQLYKVVNG